MTKATTRPYNAAAAAAYATAASTYTTTALPAYTTAVTTYNAGATAAAAATAAGVARTNANPNSEWLVYTSVDGTAAANVNGGVPLTIKFDRSRSSSKAPAASANRARRAAADAAITAISPMTCCAATPAKRCIRRSPISMRGRRRLER